MRRIGWKHRLKRPGRLRPVCAWELLQARQEAECLAPSDESFGLCLNACVLARALYRRGHPRFSCGEALLKTLPENEIRALTAQYLARFSDRTEPRERNPHFDEKRFEELSRR